jgi:hypothetical protein
MPELTRSPLVRPLLRSLTGANPAEPARRIAAVSPTFGRLFEGTDVDTAGQTAPTGSSATSRRTPNTPPRQRSRFAVDTTVRRARRHAIFLESMFPKYWPRLPKPVSFCQCRFHPKRPPQAKPSRAARTEVRVPGRAVEARSSALTERQLHNALSCPHLWITMWTVRHRFICRPSIHRKGVLVVDR